MFSSFIGGSLGSALGTYAWSQASWAGVCVVGMVMMVLALGIYLLRSRRSMRE
jgi:predicted MFS family arabinose efflux permease